MIDKRLADECEYIGFHPMQNDATTAISREDLHKIVKLSNHTPEIIDFTKLTSDEAPATQAKGGDAPA